MPSAFVIAVLLLPPTTSPGSLEVDRSVEGAQSARVVRLQVATALDESIDETVRVAAHAAVRERLERERIQLDDGASSRLSVSIAWNDDGTGDVALAYIVVADDGSPQRIDRRCVRCGTDEIIEQLVHDLPEIVALLRATPSAPAPPSAAPPRAPVDASSPRSSSLLRPLGKAGIALTAIGVAALVTGIALVARGQDVRVAMNPQYLEGSDYRPAGYAVVASAAALVIAGVPMLVVDRVRARKQQRIALSPTWAGAHLVLRW